MRSGAMRRLALVAALLVLASPALRAQTAPGKRGCTIPNFPAPTLCARAGLDTVHATYILLVDESGSMAPLWPAVKQALAEFAEAVPDGDELDVRLFSSSVHSLIAPVPATPVVRAGWMQSIRSLPSPHGTSTDLGRAAESALAQVKSAPPERLQFVFFLTDGQHAPDGSSPFPTSWGGQWPAVASQAEMLVGSRPVSVAIVRLTTAADQSLLTKAFPSAVVTDAIGPDALRNWFSHTRREVAVSKLTTLIRRELAQPIARIESNGLLVLHGDRQEQHSVRVVNRRRIVETLPANSAPVGLGGREAIVPTTSLWSSDTGTLKLSGKEYAPWVPPGSIPGTLDERVVIRTRLEPSQELRRIGISAGPRPDTLHVKLTTLGGGSLSGWLYYGICVVLAAVVLFLIRGTRRRAHRAVLDGRVIVTGANRSSAGATHALRGRKLKTFTVTTDDGRELLRLDAKNEKGRTVVYATPLTGDMTLRNKPFRTPSALTGKSVFAANGDEVTYLLS